MKKQLFFGVILAAMIALPNTLFAQSTEGTDFWVTFLRANNNGPDQHNLSLVFAAKQTAKVHVENLKTGFDSTIVVNGGETFSLENLNKSDCYVGDDEEETVSDNALHISSDKVISVIASNYGRKTFDVAAIMPTKALLSEYYVQCYSPSSHGSDDPSQGSHFAIVAAEDNVVVDFVPTVKTWKMYKGQIPQGIGDTITTPVLNKGQVYYVWTGEGEKSDYDFTGTWIKARDRKKIAVFNGNPHTNIPYKINSRDHVFSQAMPIDYWGRNFALTSSLTTIKETPAGSTWERLDKVRIIALKDSTVVKVNGDTLHVFSFEDGDNDDKKHFFEFEFGALDSKSNWQKDPERPNIKRDTTDNCYIETSCPCAVHLFLTSNRYDHDKMDGNKKYCNGDPSLIWINPIEQRIDTLTFGTFETNQVKDHFLNIVTLNEPNNLNSVKYDNGPIDAEWKTMIGNPDYVFARKKIIHGTHSLTADSGFIAHVYGFGDEESYGYPAGGNTRNLSAALYIDGTPYSSEGDNLLCGDKSVLFECRLDYKPDSIYWYFGDGADTLLIGVDSIRHFYDIGQRGNVTFEAYVKIFREVGTHDDDCYEWTNYEYDSIHFHVNVGMPTIEVKRIEIPRCIPLGTATDIQIVLDNPAKVDLTSDSVQITLEQKAILAGFKDEDIQIQGDSMIIVHVPADTPDRTPYNMHIHIGSQCESTVFDKDIEFHMEYAIKQLEQRYNNVLGLIASKYVGKTLSDFVWIHNAVDTLQNQQSSVLYLDENDPETSGDYFVCYTVKEEGKEEFRECTCPVTFDPNGKGHSFDPDVDNLTVSGSVAIKGNTAFVNADWQGKTDIECYAQWISVSGATSERYNLPDGGRAIPTPTENGFYILRVVTDGAGRSFKIYINH